MKTRTKLTPKQVWHRERNFITYGRLTSIKNSLRDISESRVVTTTEALVLSSMVITLSRMLTGWNTETSKYISFELFNERNR